MSRVNEFSTDAEFIRFRFPDAVTAEKAAKFFPSDFVTTEPDVIEYRAGKNVAAIRDNLDAREFEWEETESSLADDDLWPEWTGDAEIPGYSM